MQKKNKKKIEKVMDLLGVMAQNSEHTEKFEHAKAGLDIIKKSLSDRDKEVLTKEAKEKDFDVLYYLVRNNLCTDSDLENYILLYQDYLKGDIDTFRLDVTCGAAYYELPKVMPLLHKIIDENKKNAIEYVRLLLKYNDIKSWDKVWADESCVYKNPLFIAVEKGNVEMVGTLLDAGADELYADVNSYLHHTVGMAIVRENYDVVMAFMKRQKGFPNRQERSYSLNMAKLLDVYGEPEKFLELACVPQDKLVYFKKAAMYGLLKRYYVLHADDVISKDKKEKYKENLELIEQIKEKAKELEATSADANTLKEKLVTEAKTIAPEEFAPAAESTPEPTAKAEEKTK